MSGTLPEMERLMMDARRTQILEDLRRDGRVLSKELARRYGVSEDAVRRDLRDLASLKLLQRVHGGALPLSHALEPYAVRRAQQAGAKEDVARTAARWVQPGQVLFVDGGSTLAAVISHLPVDANLTVITHNLPAALALAERPDIRGVLLGGLIDPVSQITSGARTHEEISRLHADVCLLGVCGLHAERGLSAAHYEEAQLKRAMIRQSAECAVILTQDKLGTTAPYAVVPTVELDTLITEAQVTVEQLKPYRESGLQIVQ